MFNQLPLGIRSKNGEIWRTILPFVSLIIRSKRWLHSLFLKRCSPANSSVTSHNIQQTWEAVFWNCSLWLKAERQAHDLFLKRCSKACICGNKFNQTKNMRSYFCLAVLITWCKLLTTIMPNKEMWHKFCHISYFCFLIKKFLYLILTLILYGFRKEYVSWQLLVSELY